MYKILQDKMHSLQGEAVDFAQQLVRTESPSLNESKVGDLVESAMQAQGYHKVFRDDFGNVVGLLSGVRQAPTILLNCHMDTVAPSDNEKDPLSGKIADGRLYGLGSADCKGGLAAQIFAGSLLKRSLLPLKGNLIVAATTAEENGLSIGLRGLIESTLPDLGLKPDFVMLGEPTDLGLYYGHDGWMELDVRVEGLNPFEVDDAVNAIVGDLGQGSVRSVDGRLQREMLKVSELDFRNGKGGRSASLRLARRMEADEDIENVLGEVQKGMAKVAGSAGGQVAVDVMVRQEKHRLYTGKVNVVRHVTRAWCTDPFHPMLDRARQALEAAGSPVKPGKWQLGRLGMGTAGSVLVNEYKIPTVGYGPGLETQAHAPGEYVELAKLSAALYGSAVIAHSLVGIPVCGWTSDEI